MKIGVLSDTHGWVDPAVYEHFAGVDEIWHAGDAGNIDVITELESFKPLRAVWGNCDDFGVRRATKEYLFFKVGNEKCSHHPHRRLSRPLFAACAGADKGAEA